MHEMFKFFPLWHFLAGHHVVFTMQVVDIDLSNAPIILEDDLDDMLINTPLNEVCILSDKTSDKHWIEIFIFVKTIYPTIIFKYFIECNKNVTKWKIQSLSTRQTKLLKLIIWSELLQENFSKPNSKFQ